MAPKNPLSKPHLLNFLQVNIVSVSSDGDVKLWDVVKNEMESKNILVLFDKSLEKESDDQNVPPKACGTCLEFHPINSYMFLVGTEEGKIYKCSTSYSSQVKLLPKINI